MKKKSLTRHLWYLGLLICLLLGSSQAGMVSAEPDEWLAEETGEETRAVQPGSWPFTIANKASNPAVAHGGDHYMIVYSHEGAIWANVRNNDGTEYHSFEVHGPPGFYSNPKVAYHSASGLFLVSYIRALGPQVNIRFISHDGWVGNGELIHDAVSSDVACNQDNGSCLLALHTKIDGLDYFHGYYINLVQPVYTISLIGPESLSNISGRNPKLAWGKGTGTYLFAFTRKPPTANDDIFYTHVHDTFHVGENAYTHYAKQIIHEPNILTNDKEVKGVTYDPCTQHYLVLFDHKFSLSIIDVYYAAIHKTNDVRSSFGTVAYNDQREYGGGISFVTDDHLPATCGPMNKLVATYANMNTDRFYAVEIRGNNNPDAPVYQLDPDGEHFEVFFFNYWRPKWWPVISSGSSNGEMFIAMDIIHKTDTSEFQVWGRFVHVEVPEEVSFNKTSPNDGALVRINPSLAWEESSNADNYEYCYAKTNTCSVWIDNGTDTSTSPNDLEYNTTYYWQVRANKDGDTIYANGSETAFWSFITPAAGDPARASFSASPTSGPAPLTVTFTDESEGDYNTCTWHFGDGTTRTRCGNPIHTYQAIGVYTVELIISGGGGTDTETKNNYIYVGTPVPKPGAFSKTNPANGATNRPTNPTLSWGSSSNASTYEYCYDTTNDNACTNWVSNGTATSKTLSGLKTNTTYYWHVRAKNRTGTTYANGSNTAFWSFTTKLAEIDDHYIFLPLILK